MADTWLGSSQMEQEANYFAHCLLMPEEMLIPDWEKSTKDSSAVDKFAEEYHVTRMTMLVRLRGLGLYEEN